ncbi:ankyrin repeat-containing protein, partial [Tanacetum coccineum]
MTIKKVFELDNEFTQFRQESSQHRTEVNDRLDKFSAKLGAAESKLSEMMKMLSAIKLSHEQSSPKEGSPGVTQQLTRGKGLEKEDPFEEYAQFEGPNELHHGNRSNHHGSDYRIRKLKIPLFKGEDPHGWIYKVERYFEVEDIQPREKLREVGLCMEDQALSWFRWSEARSPLRSWEGLKRRLLERFQLSQEGTLYEQFLAITQEGSALEYVNLFETLAGQLVGIPEEVMEGTFIKGLRPELRSAVRVLQPEGLNHA